MRAVSHGGPEQVRTSAGENAASLWRRGGAIRLRHILTVPPLVPLVCAAQGSPRPPPSAMASSRTPRPKTSLSAPPLLPAFTRSLQPPGGAPTPFRGDGAAGEFIPCVPVRLIRPPPSSRGPQRMIYFIAWVVISALLILQLVVAVLIEQVRRRRRLLPHQSGPFTEYAKPSIHRVCKMRKQALQHRTSPTPVRGFG